LSDFTKTPIQGEVYKASPYKFLKELGRKGNVGQYLTILHWGLHSNLLKTTPLEFTAANQVDFRTTATSIHPVGLRSHFMTDPFALLIEI